VAASLIFLISFTLRRIPKIKGGRGIYLKSDQEGYVASEYDASLIGKSGKVLADLKPSGFIYIDEHQYQAISQSGYLVKGTEITVIGGRGAFLIVKEKINKGNTP
jgi:membrane-bound ClpP family serine protease